MFVQDPNVDPLLCEVINISGDLSNEDTLMELLVDLHGRLLHLTATTAFRYRLAYDGATIHEMGGFLGNFLHQVHNHSIKEWEALSRC